MRPGCLLAAGLVILGAVVAAAAVTLSSRESGVIDLGRETDYELSSVLYRSTDHFFVVRLADGEVIAISDRDPHNLRRRSSCRVTFRPDLGAGGDVAGESGASGRFFDGCTGSEYDRSGRGLAGDGLDLRRIPVRDEDGRLRVKRGDLSGR